MTSSERHLIDSLEFAKQSLEIHDKIRASNLAGLKDILFSETGDIEYRLTGGGRLRGKYSLHLAVRGTLIVRCQRCLGEMDYPVNLDRTFLLAKDESELPDEEFEDDEVDYLVVEPGLNVDALVEEEVILSMPLALRHENECPELMVSTSSGNPNPFKVLAGLKKQ